MPMFLFLFVVFFFFFYHIAQKLCKTSLYCFAPADRMIMNYFVPVCPLLPFAADTAAVLHMPNLHVPVCIISFTENTDLMCMFMFFFLRDSMFVLS